MRGVRNEQIIREFAARLAGRYEAQIEAYASGINCPPDELTARVATLLLGTGSGASDSMPNLRESSPARTEVRLPAVEVAHRSPSAKSSGKPSKISLYWKRLGKKGRAEEMARRIKKRAK